MPNCSAYERGALSALPQYRVALQDSRSLSRLLATASLVQRVALPEGQNTIGSFLGLVLHGIRTWLRPGIFHHDKMSEEQAKVRGAPGHGLDISAQSCRQGEGPKKST